MTVLSEARQWWIYSTSGNKWVFEAKADALAFIARQPSWFSYELHTVRVVMRSEEHQTLKGGGK